MYLPLVWVSEVWYSSCVTDNKELLCAKVLLWKSNLDTQTFWCQKVDQNISPPDEKSWPENSASQTLENFNQVFAAFVFQRSGGIPKLRLEILKTSKHGNETSNFKDLMVVRFSAIRIKDDNIETRRNYHLLQRSTGEVSYHSFVQTDLN